MRRFSALFLTAGFAFGCGGSKQSEVPGPQFPERPAGCEVTSYHDTAPGPTTNIGPVRASCGEDISEADCLRTLKDEVCKLGGDVAVQVSDEPLHRNGKLEWSGRAAHTK